LVCRQALKSTTAVTWVVPTVIAVVVVMLIVLGTIFVVVRYRRSQHYSPLSFSSFLHVCYFTSARLANVGAMFDANMGVGPRPIISFCFMFHCLAMSFCR